MVRVSKPNPASVRATFESVAHRYDLANHVLSGGIDFIWRKKLVEWALKGNCSQVLDLATGSGDVAFALRKALPSDAIITGIDFCEPMLEQARSKRGKSGLSKDANKFIAGDCLDLHFDDNQFDLLTISFGLRNLEDRELGFKEAYRVLKPNGRLIVLEFSQPYSWFRPFYYFYLLAVLPWMARLITGDRNAYLYLGTSISAFPNRSKLAEEFTAVGFSEVVYCPMTFSIVSLHMGTKKD